MFQGSPTRIEKFMQAASLYPTVQSSFNATVSEVANDSTF